MGERRNGLGHLDNVFVGFIRDFLGFFLPGAWSSFQYSVNSRSEVWYATGCGDTGPGKGNKVFAVENQLSKDVDFLI